MIKAVIFDLDGTLLNTLSDLADSVNYALKKNGLGQRTTDEIRSFVGGGVRILMKRSVPDGIDGEVYEKAFLDFREYYLRNMRNKTEPYRGIREMLEKLKAEGIATGVVSNKLDSAVKALCRDFFGDLIDFAKGADGEDDRKPNPQNTLICMERLGFGRENTVYVGDSDIDIKTAKNAGLDCISVSWGFRTREELIEAGAAVIIDKPRELISHLGL